MTRSFIVRIYSLLTLFLIAFAGVYCNRNKASKTKLILHIYHAYGHKVFLQTIAYAEEKTVIIDSAIVKKGNDTIELHIPEGEERPYRLRVSGSGVEIPVINDSPVITAEANILRPFDYSVKNSPATSSVRLFLENQLKSGFKSKRDAALIDSLKIISASKYSIDSLTVIYNQEIAGFFKQYINYADTVSSPAAFLLIYNNVDFGNDYNGLKIFILKAAQRFKKNAGVQKLKNSTLEFLKVFEEEYEVGNYLPELLLPDKDGNIFSTYSLKGKYIFMDFWSTWCRSCMQYDLYKKDAKKLFSKEKFEIVSIAMDSEKDTWKKMISNPQYNWPQLIDTLMWRGITERTMKIDSIPFNFLLSPEGKILKKAIPSDSLLIDLKELIH